MTEDLYPNGKRFWWLNDESHQVLNRGYLLSGETTEGAIDRITTAASKRLFKPELQPVFKEMIEKGWISMSSPIWANMGTQRGLPISCFNVHIPDSVEGIASKLGEVIMQTKIGGGTSGFFGEMRGRGTAVTNNGKSSGAVSFMKLFDTTMDVVSQGGVRRGAFAGYLDIDHPDIEEFLQIKSIGSPIQNLFTGVCVSDYWMQEMIDGDESKREIWAKVLESRQQKGLPYIFFTDNINRQKPDIYKELGLTINASNLCSEIALPSTTEESFICCLASMNLALYDEWRDTNAVEMAIFFLDAVLSEFIEKTKDNHFLRPAHDFATRHRALGLGVMGWHSYLQSIGRPFGHPLNIGLTRKIFGLMQAQAYSASEKLGTIYGNAPIYHESKVDYGRRNTTLMAIAPTTSSSSILGQVSPGIEPFSANFFKAGLAKGNFIRKNKYLEKLLEEKGHNTEEVWREIMLKKGSVMSLSDDILSPEEKDIFKTFKEISQFDIIEQATTRQKFIDQAQSLNLNIPSAVPVKDVNNLIIKFWKEGGKTLYYQRGESVAKELLSNIVSCSSCEA